MEQVTAKLCKGGEILRANAKTWMHMATRPGGVPSWGGSLTQPRGVVLPLGELLELEADDGRRGAVFIDQSNTDAGDTLVHFTGRGVFGRPA